MALLLPLTQVAVVVDQFLAVILEVKLVEMVVVA
jgi:hypothetical protein